MATLMRRAFWRDVRRATTTRQRCSYLFQTLHDELTIATDPQFSSCRGHDRGSSKVTVSTRCEKGVLKYQFESFTPETEQMELSIEHRK
jgi:hypothetical protein